MHFSRHLPTPDLTTPSSDERCTRDCMRNTWSACLRCSQVRSTRGLGSGMTSVKQSSSAFDRNVEGNKSLYLEMMADLVTDTVNRHESTLSQHPHLNYHPLPSTPPSPPPVLRTSINLEAGTPVKYFKLKSRMVVVVMVVAVDKRITGLCGC